VFLFTASEQDLV